jgi:Protein of unknown function (DUF2934)
MLRKIWTIFKSYIDIILLTLAGVGVAGSAVGPPPPAMVQSAEPREAVRQIHAVNLAYQTGRSSGVDPRQPPVPAFPRLPGERIESRSSSDGRRLSQLLKELRDLRYKVTHSSSTLEKLDALVRIANDFFGVFCNDHEFREMLTELGKALAKYEKKYDEDRHRFEQIDLMLTFMTTYVTMNPRISDLKLKVKSTRKRTMDAFEKAIRERAYELWDLAGRPDGRSEEFWFAARAEFERKGRE